MIQLFVLEYIIMAFAIMAFKIRKHKEWLSRSPIQSRISTVAGLIVVSFVLLVIFPEIIVSAAVLSASDDISEVAKNTAQIYLITFVNCIVDPILYLYGYPPLRVAIKRKMFPLVRSCSPKGASCLACYVRTCSNNEKHERATSKTNVNLFEYDVKVKYKHIRVFKSKYDGE